MGSRSKMVPDGDGQSPQKLTLWASAPSIMRSLYSLYKNKTLCDVKIKCGNHQTGIFYIEAHSCVLAASSSVLKRSLSKTSNIGTIELRTFSKETVMQCLDFIYGQTVNIAVDEIEQILSLATQLELFEMVHSLSFVNINRVNREVIYTYFRRPETQGTNICTQAPKRTAIRLVNEPWENCKKSKYDTTVKQNHGGQSSIIRSLLETGISPEKKRGPQFDVTNCLPEIQKTCGDPRSPTGSVFETDITSKEIRRPIYNISVHPSESPKIQSEQISANSSVTEKITPGENRENNCDITKCPTESPDSHRDAITARGSISEKGSTPENNRGPTMKKITTGDRDMDYAVQTGSKITLRDLLSRNTLKRNTLYTIVQTYDERFPCYFVRLESTSDQVKKGGDESGETKFSDKHKLVCKNCFEYFDDVYTLKEHSSACKFEENRYVCRKCGIKTRSPKSGYFKHLHRYHNIVRSIRCPDCHQLFLEACKYTKHKEGYCYKQESSSVKCLHCDRTFAGRNSLRTHMKRVKSNPESLRLKGICKSYVQDKPQKYTCSTCNMTIYGLRRYRSHRYTHKKNCVCCKCRKGFSCLKNLNKHLRASHQLAEHNKTTFECKACNFKTVHEVRYKLHMQRKHPSSKQVLTCGICSKTLRSKIEIVNHLKHEHHIELPSLEESADKQESGMPAEKGKTTSVKKVSLGPHPTKVEDAKEKSEDTTTNVVIPTSDLQLIHININNVPII